MEDVMGDIPMEVDIEEGEELGEGEEAKIP